MLGRREDGFHSLRSVFCALRLADRLELTPTPDGVVEIAALSGPTATGVPRDGRNLVVRALTGFRQETGTPLGARVRLHKRIPNCAGLGGGSSNAAAALLAANRAWGVGASTDEVSRIAQRFGSDIPFFVHALDDASANRETPRRPQKAAICTGRGEIVAPTPSVGGAPCVIVKPPYGLSTASVYHQAAEREYDDSGGDSSALAEAIATQNASRAAAWMGNALQAAATAVEPRLRGIVTAFGALPVLAHQLCGSGSAYFGLCESFAVARRVAARLRAARLGDVYLTATC